MPKLKSSRKRLRTNLREQTRNKAVRSSMRTAIKKVRQAEGSEGAGRALREACSLIDKSVKKGAIPGNRGDRYKSRLTRLVNKLA